MGAVAVGLSGEAVFGEEHPLAAVSRARRHDGSLPDRDHRETERLHEAPCDGPVRQPSGVADPRLPLEQVRIEHVGDVASGRHDDDRLSADHAEVAAVGVLHAGFDTAMRQNPRTHVPSCRPLITLQPMSPLPSCSHTIPSMSAQSRGY